MTYNSILMHKYEIIMYWSNEDNAFVAEVPELPGCAAHGDTQEMALAEVKQAMDLWIDTAREFGDTIPEPKGERLDPGVSRRNRSLSSRRGHPRFPTPLPDISSHVVTANHPVTPELLALQNARSDSPLCTQDYLCYDTLKHRT